MLAAFSFVVDAMQVMHRPANYMGKRTRSLPLTSTSVYLHQLSILSASHPKPLSPSFSFNFTLTRPSPTLLFKPSHSASTSSSPHADLSTILPTVSSLSPIKDKEKDVTLPS
ncbi:hypothetical protein EW146_g5863 [Bondarzewia mesenterica]|uniref:Uncharacterized protein n=1 Tax=Bondarzewia mesenterica TaxID=1095465 RepID=A0A4S4LVX4_9AGAM|nr:hypothetical protein EW146_g5863 [Bondarzewia mesenterica]